MPKVKDPGGFYTFCSVNDMLRAFCDLGSSVSTMSYSLFKTLNVGKLHSISMTLELADLIETKPLGIVKNVHVKIKNALIPMHFVVLDMKFNDKYILLGKAFSYIFFLHLLEQLLM